MPWRVTTVAGNGNVSTVELPDEWVEVEHEGEVPVMAAEVAAQFARLLGEEARSHGDGVAKIAFRPPLTITVEQAG